MHQLPEETTVVLAVTSRPLLAEDATQRPLFLISSNYCQLNNGVLFQEETIVGTWTDESRAFVSWLIFQ